MTHSSRLLALGCGVLITAGCGDSPTGPTQGVTVYVDKDFEDGGRVFDGDAVDLNLIAGPCDGSWNDCISSIRIPNGWEVTIFEDDSFDGDSLTLISDTPDLNDVRGPCGDDWDDCISSLQARRR